MSSLLIQSFPIPAAYVAVKPTSPKENPMAILDLIRSNEEIAQRKKDAIRKKRINTLDEKRLLIEADVNGKSVDEAKMATLYETVTDYEADRRACMKALKKDELAKKVEDTLKEISELLQKNATLSQLIDTNASQPSKLITKHNDAKSVFAADRDAGIHSVGPALAFVKTRQAIELVRAEIQCNERRIEHLKVLSKRFSREHDEMVCHTDEESSLEFPLNFALASTIHHAEVESFSDRRKREQKARQAEHVSGEKSKNERKRAIRIDEIRESIDRTKAEIKNLAGFNDSHDRCISLHHQIEVWERQILAVEDGDLDYELDRKYE